MKEPDYKWLETHIQYAKGVGPFLAKLFKRLNIESFEELIYHIPFRYLDRRKLQDIGNVQLGEKQLVLGTVEKKGVVVLGRRGKRVFEVLLRGNRGSLMAKWFHYNQKYLEKRFNRGDKILLFGEVSEFRGQLQMVHPEVQPLSEVISEQEIEEYLGLVPVYPSTEGLTQYQIRKIIKNLIEDHLDRMGETLPDSIKDKLEFPDLVESLRRIHFPKKEDDYEQFQSHKTGFHKRIIFDEFFYLQLGLTLRREKNLQVTGIQHRPLFFLRERFLAGLPFELTNSQLKAIETVTQKMCSLSPMNCLLQGDVGSGKTIVAMVGALLSVDNGFQAAIMVPTEILAEQHYVNFKRLLEPLGVQVKILTSSTKASTRAEILAQLKQGEPLMLIGTHALLEGDVQFGKLSLVVVDEQHRFGVRQRMNLMQKGVQPDVLVMTATPIPRSLAMTLYGDLDLALMTDMPKGRKPILTRVMLEKDRPKLYEFIRQKVTEGRQVYFVLPLIEESEKLDLKDATKAYHSLKKEFPAFKVELIHGRLKGEEKERIMREFSQGNIQILVATTVIEVGIDVPNATMMVIEHAERFGLSQLHQLRGRVGRGSEKSYCILATGYKKSELAKERLQVMEKFRDGFRIAEEDLKIRGPGDFLGTRQSGIPELRVANLVTDLEILEQARTMAQEILSQDSELIQGEHAPMRRILAHRWGARLGLANVG